MPSTRSLYLSLLAFALAAVSLPVFAQTETVLYSFQSGADAVIPQSALVADSQGNLYGTSSYGGSGLCNGSSVCGAIFRLSPPASSGAPWTETVIYSFQGGSDGSNPLGSLIFDKSGNLYGTTSGGGSGMAGTAFELSPPSGSGGLWTETILYDFQAGTDASEPFAGLVFDKKGNLYGTSRIGGAGSCGGFPGCGAIFQLTPPSSQGASWTERVIHNFGYLSDGSEPKANLLVDNTGALLGTTWQAGKNSSCEFDAMALGCGTVFRLTPPPYIGGGWKESQYSFPSQLVGAFPTSGLVVGKNGRLYGTTTYGGSGPCFDQDEITVGCGVIFEVIPPNASFNSWRETTIYSFSGLGDGAYPYAGLVADKDGNLYGTAEAGGGAGSCRSFPYTNGCGTAFKLGPPASPGGSWTETTLHQFAGDSDGAAPVAGLVSDRRGGFYGTTAAGGGQILCSHLAPGCGTIFHLVP